MSPPAGYLRIARTNSPPANSSSRRRLVQQGIDQVGKRLALLVGGAVEKHGPVDAIVAADQQRGTAGQPAHVPLGRFFPLPRRGFYVTCSGIAVYAVVSGFSSPQTCIDTRTVFRVHISRLISALHGFRAGCVEKRTVPICASHPAGRSANGDCPLFHAGPGWKRLFLVPLSWPTNAEKRPMRRLLRPRRAPA